MNAVIDQGESIKDVNPILAEHHGLGCVRICGCGSLNLNIGFIALRLNPEAFLKPAGLAWHGIQVCDPRRSEFGIAYTQDAIAR